MAYYTGLREKVQVTSEEVAAFSKRSRVSEEQVFFKLNMAFLARDAKADSVLRAELPTVKKKYRIMCDTAKVRSMLKTPDAILTEEPVKMFVREVFQ